MNDPLVIAGQSYASRLLVGTGKYKDFDETRRAVLASGERECPRRRLELRGKCRHRADSLAHRERDRRASSARQQDRKP